MTVRLSASSNIDEVFAKLDGYLADVKERALTIALNKLGEQARVAGERQILKTYGLTINQFAKYITVTPAFNGGRLEYVIAATGKGFPLQLFAPRQVKGIGGGVSVLLKGKRVLVHHAFLKAIRGNEQVWARGSYNAGATGAGTTGKGSGKRRKRGIREATGRSAFEATGERFGRFAYGRNRFPITLLRSTTPPSALMSPEVIATMNARITEQAPSVIATAIRFANRG